MICVSAALVNMGVQLLYSKLTLSVGLGHMVGPVYFLISSHIYIFVHDYFISLSIQPLE